MSRYEDKLYDFITDPENFEFAHEIWDKYEEIKERLIKEFWNDVKKYCDMECPQSFILKTNEDFLDGDDPELYFKKVSWKFFIVGFSSLMDNPFLGVYLYDENLKKRTVNTIIKWAKDLEILDDFYIDYDEEDGYFAWKNTNDDFDNLSILKRILPTKRDEMVKLYSNHLINLSKEMEETIDKWEKEINEGKI